MYEDFKENLRRWDKEKSDRQKLQHTYIAIIVIATLVAGLVSLINPELGRRIVRVSLVSLIAFLANFLVWSVLSSAVLSKIPKRNGKK